MKFFAALLLLSISTATMSADNLRAEDVTFSNYSADLKLASYDEETGVHQFTGTITLVGTFFLEFDMETPNRSTGEIMFESFVPDSAYAAQLPVVVDGFYPSPLSYLSFEIPREKIIPLFGGKEKFERIARGQAHTVGKRAVVILDSYRTGVECDSRFYTGNVVSITPEKKSRQVAIKEYLGGC
jgi:hypothetical protein